jgi:hypothetical protein
MSKTYAEVRTSGDSEYWYLKYEAYIMDANSKKFGVASADMAFDKKDYPTKNAFNKYLNTFKQKLVAQGYTLR